MDLALRENMYNYRFDKKGRAWNWNGLAQFNPYGSDNMRGQGQLEEGYEDLFNASGRRVATRKSAKEKDDVTVRNGARIKALNGAIVRDLKML